MTAITIDKELALRVLAYIEKTAKFIPHTHDQEGCDLSNDLRAAIEARPQEQWQPIETAPKDGRKVILFYVNMGNLPRCVMAKWLSEEEAEDSDHDGVGLEAGWYECIDNWNDYSQVAIYQGVPKHWMPIPTAPGVATPHQAQPRSVEDTARDAGEQFGKMFPRAQPRGHDHIEQHLEMVAQPQGDVNSTHTTAAKMPNGETAKNVYEAYDIGWQAGIDFVNKWKAKPEPQPAQPQEPAPQPTKEQK